MNDRFLPLLGLQSLYTQLLLFIYQSLYSLVPAMDRFQRERLGTAFPKLFWQWWERRSQECKSPLVIRYTINRENAATLLGLIRNSLYNQCL